MKYQQKLRQLIIENPELPMKFFYSSEGCDGFDYTLGGIQKVFIDELGEYDGYLWLKDLEYDSLVDTIENNVVYELYPEETSKSRPVF